MCIRDRPERVRRPAVAAHHRADRLRARPVGRPADGSELRDCLLYTSDAADERSSVDLGGRRIIKKKKNRRLPETQIITVISREYEQQ